MHVSEGGSVGMREPARGARAALVALALAAVALLGAAGMARPQQAQAFAWKDTCTINVVNKTGSTGSVRPTALIQVPPNTYAYAQFVAHAATGFPTNVKLGFSNTGIPLTNGCSSNLQLYNPADNVKCIAIAPTVGRNTFYCNGNSTFKVETDNDDITGTAYVPKGSARVFGEPQAPGFLRRMPTEETPSSPKLGHGVLHRSALAGGGWKATRKVSDLGRFGKLLEASSPTGSCDNRSEAGPQPHALGASLFVRHRGAEAVGEFDGRYGSRGAAGSTLTAVTSRASAGCLAEALTAPGYKATVAAVGPNFGQGGLPSQRIAITQVGGAWKGYVDVVGIQLEARNAVALFFSQGGPPSKAREEAVLVKIGAGLGR